MRAYFWIDLRRQSNNELRYFQEDEQLGETKNKNLSNLQEKRREYPSVQLI
jgi:hypothetical protein